MVKGLRVVEEKAYIEFYDDIDQKQPGGSDRKPQCIAQVEEKRECYE